MTVILNRDEKRGHFHLNLSDGREVTGADLGPVLHLWTAGAHLTPGAARQLAEVLTWWADRRQAAAAAEPEQLDLFGETTPEPETSRG